MHNEKKPIFRTGNASLLQQLWKSTSCARKGFSCVMDAVKKLVFEDFLATFLQLHIASISVAQ